MYTNQNERVLRLRDLVLGARCRWRQVLTAAVAGALLLGLGAGILAGLWANDLQAQQQAQAEFQRQYEAYAAKLEYLQEDIERLRSYTAQQQRYLKESVLMNIDPYCSFGASWNLYVTSTAAASDVLLLAYQTELSSSDALQAVAQQVQVSSKYLKELFSIRMNTDSDGKPNHFLTVTIRYPNGEGAMEILEAMHSLVPEIQRRLRQSLGSHTVSHSFTGAVCGVDLDLANHQRSEANRLSQYETSLQAQETALEGLRPPISMSMTSVEAVLLGLAGLFCGAVLGWGAGLVWQCFRIAGQGLVLSAVELEENLGIRVLGTVASGSPKGSWDQRFLRKKGLMLQNTPENNALVAAAVAAVRKNGKAILIAGQGAQGVRQALGSLPDISCCGEFFGEPGALEKAEAVILAVSRGKTRYEDLNRQLRWIREEKKPLLGLLLEEY